MSRIDAPSQRTPALLRAPGAALALLAAVLLLRLPAFVVGLVNLDECDFALFGRAVRAGAAPYRGVADIKPPLTYLAYGIAGLFGPHPGWAVPVLGVVALLATAALLGAVAHRWTGDARAGWAAAWLSLAGGLCDAPSVSAEVLMNVPVAAALLAFLAAERSGQARRDLAAGVLAALATLFKLQAGILLVAFAIALAAGPTGARLRRLAALGAGYVLPWLATLAAMAAWGAVPEFLDWVVRRNVFQISSAETFAWINVLPSIAAALGATAFAWTLAVRGARDAAADRFGRAVVLLLALTIVPVSIGRRFYEHYFLQFVPPLALLGAPALVRLAERWRTLGRGRRLGWAALLALPLAAQLAFVNLRALRGGYPGQEPKVRAVASWLRAHTAPGERVFMWGDDSVLYCLAGRLPGTRYLRTAPHVGDFDPLQLPAGFDFAPHRSARDVALALEDLAARRPEIVVDTAAADLHRWSLFPLARVPELDAYIQAHYEAVARPAGAVVYRRRDALAHSR